MILFLLVSFNLYSQTNDELKKYLDITASEPGNYQNYNRIGLIYIQNNDLQNAKNYFVKSIIINNNYFEGYYNLGLLYFKSNKMNDALVNFKRALTISSSVDLYVNIINSYICLKQLDEASKYLTEAMKLYNNNYKLFNCAGIIKLYKNDFKAAKENFQEALKLQNGDRIRNNLAIAEYLLGNKTESKKILNSLKKSLNLFDENFKMVNK